MSFDIYSLSSLSLDSNLKKNNDDDYTAWKPNDQDQLLDLLRLPLNNDELVNQIKNKYKGISNANNLLRDLTLSLCRMCINSGKQLNEEMFRSKCSILKPFIDKKIELELEALKALQLIDEEINDKRSNFIRCAFNALAELSIIREGAFYKWRNSSDQLNNKASIRRLKDFFTSESQKQRCETQQNQENLPQNKPVVVKLSKKQRKKLKNLLNENTPTPQPAQIDSNRLVDVFNTHDSDESLLVSHLKAEFQNKEMLTKKVIRVLVNALCLSCMDSDNLFKITAFNKRCHVLKTFINNREPVEIETMKTIQAFFNQIENKIPGFDQVIFLYLFENGIVNQNALNALTDSSTHQIKTSEQEKSKKQTDSLQKFNKLIQIFNLYDSNESVLLLNLRHEFDNKETLSKKLIPVLVEALCASCMNYSEKKFEMLPFSRRSLVLKHFINKNKVIEEETVKVIKSFFKQSDNKLPNFDPLVLFLYLHDNNILSERSLKGLVTKNNSKEENKKANAKKEKPKISNIKAAETDRVQKSEQSKEQAQENMAKFANCQNVIEKKLHAIFADYSLNSQEISLRIQTEIKEEEIKSKWFINELVLCFLKSCLHGVHFNSELFKKRCSLLSPMLSKNSQGEIETLNCITNFWEAIQNMTDTNLLAIIFDVLYMEKTIGEEAFLIWKSNAKPRDLDSLKEFFHKLSQNKSTGVLADFNKYLIHQQNSPAPTFVNQFVPSLIQPIPVSIINSVSQMPVQYYMPIAQPQLVTSMYQPHNLINSSLLHSNNNNLNNKPKEHKQSSLEKKAPVKNLKSNYSASVLTDAPTSPVSDPICPICIETISSLKKQKIRLMSTQCGHLVCQPCIKMLFLRSPKSIECPMCRKSLTRNLIHDLFI